MLNIVGKNARIIILCWSFLCSTYLIMSFFQESVTDSPLPLPWFGAADFVENSTGDVYIAAALVPRIDKYSNSGRLLASFSSPERRYPASVRLAAGSDGTLYVKTREGVVSYSATFDLLSELKAPDDNVFWKLNDHATVFASSESTSVPSGLIHPGETLFPTESRKQFECVDGTLLRHGGSGLQRITATGEMVRYYGTPWYFFLFRFPWPALASGVLLLVFLIIPAIHLPRISILPPERARERSILFVGKTRDNKLHSVVVQNVSEHETDLLFLPDWTTRVKHVFLMTLVMGMSMAAAIAMLYISVRHAPGWMAVEVGTSWLKILMEITIILPPVYLILWAGFVIVYSLAGCEKLTIDTSEREIGFFERFVLLKSPFHLEVMFKRMAAPFEETQVHLHSPHSFVNNTFPQANRLTLWFGRKKVILAKDYSDAARQHAFEYLQTYIPQHQQSRQSSGQAQLRRALLYMLLGIAIFIGFGPLAYMFLKPNPKPPHTTRISHAVKQHQDVPAAFSLHGTDDVESLSFSPDGARLVTAGRNSLTLWDVRSQKILRRLQRGTSTRKVHFLPDARTIFSIPIYADDIKEFLLWNTDTDVKTRLSSSAFKEIAESRLDISTFNAGLFAGVDYSAEQPVRVWRLHDGRLIRSFRLSFNNLSRIEDLAISDDGQLLAVAYELSERFLWMGGAIGPPRIAIFRIETGEEIQKSLAGHGRYDLHSAFSPDNQYLASGGEDEQLMVWNIAQPENSMTFTGHNVEITDVAYSPDGQWLVSVAGEYVRSSCPRGEIKIWDMKSHRGVMAMKTLYAAHDAEFSPDGKLLAVATACDENKEAVLIWEMSTLNAEFQGN